MVTGLCDNYMQKAGPDWRDRFYATDLEKVLAISQEIDNRHKKFATGKAILRKRPPCSDPRQSHQERDPSPGRKIITSSIDSLPATLIPDMPTPLSQSTASHSSSMSPDSSFSQTSPTPSTSTNSTQTTVCDLCKATFTGEYQKSNYDRHMRTSKQHGGTSGLLCPIEGCGAELFRSDNLAKHMRKAHQKMTPLRRQGGNRRRKNSNADGD